MTASRGAVLRVAAIMLCLATPLPAQAAPAAAARAGAPPVVTSGDCPGEVRLVRRALEHSTLRVDVDGDGRLDRVAVRTHHAAGRRCRVLVGVHVRGGATYSTHLDPSAVPRPGFRARIVALPDLGNDPGADIVVDTRFLADATLAQLVTLAGGRLQRVAVPGRRDGNFIVDGGGTTHPKATDCTRRGALVLSRADELTVSRFHVTRRTYPVRGETLRFLKPRVRRAIVLARQVSRRFPEFVLPNFGACTDRVRR